MACRGGCEPIKVGKRLAHREGNSYCRTCTSGIKWEGLYCPCCGMRVAKSRKESGHAAARKKLLRAGAIPA